MLSQLRSPFVIQRNLILALLLGTAFVAWGILIWQAYLPRSDDMDMTAGVDTAVLFFMSNWMLMMVAMMFPTAGPMILTFAKIYEKRRERSQGFVPTWIFVLGYLIVWAFFGFIAYELLLLAMLLEARIPILAQESLRIGGVMLVLAGIYQLSPLKYRCLSKCRTPFDFITESWREGYRGALAMGFWHGLYCLGCCWLLFLILFPLGMANVAVLAGVTLIIFLEKSTAWGFRVAKMAASLLIIYGIAGILFPTLLRG